MEALIRHHRADELTNFSDIRKAYVEYVAVKTAYWEDLDERVLDVYKGLGEHLGVTDKVWFDGKIDQRYLSIGTTDAVDKFAEIKSLRDLKSSGNAVLFSIRLTVDTSENAATKQHVLLRFELKKDQGEYLIRIDTATKSVDTSVPSTFDESSKESLFELIARMIIGQMDKSKYL
ncbi:hypothetical protein [Pseudomonas helleri]|uniref:hypothetical protein n=1 Tax=Pseudomonas helleri TaxID=1608996 RepID=UPI003FD3B570